MSDSYHEGQLLARIRKTDLDDEIIFCGFYQVVTRVSSQDRGDVVLEVAPAQGKYIRSEVDHATGQIDADANRHAYCKAGRQWSIDGIWENRDSHHLRQPPPGKKWRFTYAGKQGDTSPQDDGDLPLRTEFAVTSTPVGAVPTEGGGFFLPISWDEPNIVVTGCDWTVVNAGRFINI